MNIFQLIKWKNVTPPAAIVDNAAVTTASVDTKDAAEWAFIVSLGALDIAVSAMKMRESNDDSTYTDITGADFSVSPLTLPSATADNNLYLITGTTTGRMRYLDLTLTGGDGAAGSYFTVLAGTLPKNAPISATERGVAQQAIV